MWVTELLSGLTLVDYRALSERQFSPEVKGNTP